VSGIGGGMGVLDRVEGKGNWAVSGVNSERPTVTNRGCRRALPR